MVGRSRRVCLSSDGEKHLLRNRPEMDPCWKTGNSFFGSEGIHPQVGIWMSRRLVSDVPYWESIHSHWMLFSWGSRHEQSEFLGCGQQWAECPELDTIAIGLLLDYKVWPPSWPLVCLCSIYCCSFVGCNWYCLGFYSQEKGFPFLV